MTGIEQGKQHWDEKGALWQVRMDAKADILFGKKGVCRLLTGSVIGEQGKTFSFPSIQGGNVKKLLMLVKIYMQLRVKTVKVWTENNMKQQICGQWHGNRH